MSHFPSGYSVNNSQEHVSFIPKKTASEAHCRGYSVTSSADTPASEGCCATVLDTLAVAARVLTDCAFGPEELAQPASHLSYPYPGRASTTEAQKIALINLNKTQGVELEMLTDQIDTQTQGGALTPNQAMTPEQKKQMDRLSQSIPTALRQIMPQGNDGALDELLNYFYPVISGLSTINSDSCHDAFMFCHHIDDYTTPCDPSLTPWEVATLNQWNNDGTDTSGLSQLDLGVLEENVGMATEGIRNFEQAIYRTLPKGGIAAQFLFQNLKDLKEELSKSPINWDLATNPHSALDSAVDFYATYPQQ